MEPETKRSALPVVFISHGSPMVAIQDNDYTRALRRLGEDLPRPRAVVIVSAHWEAPAPVRVTRADRPALIYDFGGFPEELYRLTSGAPGHPGLAGDIVDMLGAAGIEAVADPSRGLDHGAWIPMRLTYPAADVPVVQVALNRSRTPRDLVRLGKALAPLRERGVLLLGSGGIVHNLSLLNFKQEHAPVDSWATEFEEWVIGRLQEGDIEGLCDYRRSGPGADLAVPTSEHFDPVFFVLGATAKGEPVRVLHRSIVHGNLSMTTFRIG